MNRLRRHGLTLSLFAIGAASFLMPRTTQAQCETGRVILCNDGIYTDQLETEQTVDWWKVTTSCQGTLNWKIHSLSGGPWLHFWGYWNPDQCDDFPLTEGIVLPDTTEELGQYYAQPRSPGTYYVRITSITGQLGNGFYWVEVECCDGDSEPPQPDPSTWASPPNAASTTSVCMQASLATDETSPVEYSFEFMTGSGGHDSGWQTDTNYCDVGLTPNSLFCYRTTSRDSASPPNTTTPSSTDCTYTLAAVPPGPVLNNLTDVSLDVTPIWTQNPVLTEVALYDATRGCWVQSDGTCSGQVHWDDFHWFAVTVSNLTPCTNYDFRLKARNDDGIETALGPLSSASTLGCAGDLNCDAEINFADVDPFVLALIDPGEYLDQFPMCNIELADMDNSGMRNGIDAQLFINALLNVE